jgi:hypothetical protein
VVNRDKADPEGAEGRLGLAPTVHSFGVLQGRIYEYAGFQSAQYGTATPHVTHDWISRYRLSPVGRNGRERP